MLIILEADTVAKLWNYHIRIGLVHLERKADRNRAREKSLEL